MRSLLLVVALVAPQVLPASPAAKCDADCDKQAATCVDECEARFTSDPSKRVGCKVKCSEARVTCAKACK